MSRSKSGQIRLSNENVACMRVTCDTRVLWVIWDAEFDGDTSSIYHVWYFRFRLGKVYHVAQAQASSGVPGLVPGSSSRSPRIPNNRGHRRPRSQPSRRYPETHPGPSGNTEKLTPVPRVMLDISPAAAHQKASLLWTSFARSYIKATAQYRASAHE